MKTKKHNHTLTNILKVFVFSLMILMPFIIFIPNAFYYGFNEQAVAQEKTEQVPVYYESNNVSQASDFNINYVYSWNDNNIPVATGQDRDLNLLDVKILNGVYKDQNGLLYLTRPGNLWFSSNNGAVNVNTTHFDILITNIRSDINIVSNDFLSHFGKCNRLYLNEYQPLTTNMSITDSMSYAWKSTWQNDLFSWTNNTAIYTGINATTSGIGISENSYIANYLAYIFLLTVIYVIVDIILGVFTMLTHLFNKEPK